MLLIIMELAYTNMILFTYAAPGAPYPSVSWATLKPVTTAGIPAGHEQNIGLCYLQ